MYFGVPTFGIPNLSIPLFGIPGKPSGTETTIDFVFLIVGDINAITPELYKYISTKYGLVYKNIQDCYADFSNAVIHIAQIDNVEAKLDLMKPLRQSNNELVQKKFVSQLYSATIKINSHVLDRTNNSDLNDWLVENNLKVTQEWSILCQETGFPVSDSNIES